VPVHVMSVHVTKVIHGSPERSCAVFCFEVNRLHCCCPDYSAGCCGVECVAVLVLLVLSFVSVLVAVLVAVC
jgi:hypothetical protein